MAGTWPNLDQSDLSTRIREYINETTAGFYTDANINSWLNMAAQKTAQLSMCTQRIFDAVTVSGVRTVPHPAMKVAFVEYVPSDGSRPTMLTKIDPLKLNHFPLSGTAPQYWYEFGEYIGIEPLPNAAYILNLYAVDAPKLIITDDASFSTGWTAGSGWTASSSAIHTGTSATDLTYGTALSVSTAYTIIFFISALTGGASVTPYIGSVAGTPVTLPGVHMQTIVSPSSSAVLKFTGSGAFTISTWSLLIDAEISSSSNQTEILPALQHNLAIYSIARAMEKDNRFESMAMLDSIFENELKFNYQNIIEIVPDGKSSIDFQ